MSFTKHLFMRHWISLALMVLLPFLVTVSFAQEAGQSTGNTNPVPQDASKQTENAAGQPASPIGLAWADSYIHQIGSAGLLAGSREGVGWGSFYIPSASATGVFDRFEATGSVPASTYTAAVLQTALIFDHQFRTSRFAIQYSPSMAIAEGRVVGSFSNQNTSLDFLLFTRPRWNVRFSDGFSYYYTQTAFGTPYFDVNPTSGGMVTGLFLNGPARWLSDSAQVSISYALSRRASLTVTPNFTYSESGIGANLTHAAAYGGSVSWSYRTSERQSVGVQYSGSLIHETFSASSGTSGSSSDTLYHTIAGTAARQLSATLLVSGSAGVTTSSVTQAALNSRQWSFYGTFGLAKQLGRSSLGLNYFRGNTLSSGLISSLYADRVDATYNSRLIKRFGWLIGGGYLRQVGAGGFSSWYSNSEAQFLLAPRAGLFSFFNFSHNNQGISAPNLYIGNRDFYSFGIRWQPGRVAH